MSIRQTLLVAALTAIYLLFELAFNARLLDVVGGAATPDQISSIEVYGRCLSGIAVALVLFQLMLSKREQSAGKSTGYFTILLLCLATAGCVYVGIKTLVDSLCESSTPEMRRSSANLVLIQQALVSGAANLEGMDDSPNLYSKPGGKAFLAMFPLMASAVERNDSRLLDFERKIMYQRLNKRMGGPQAFYTQYQKVASLTLENFKKYEAIPAADEIDAEVGEQQDQAWNEYVSSLSSHGWTPSSVPAGQDESVRASVAKKFPVPEDWRVDDEATFRSAVSTAVHARYDALSSDGMIKVEGHTFPAGLTWEKFFANPDVQNDMRSALKLPDDVVLRPGYATGTQFEKNVYRPMLTKEIDRQLAIYTAPIDTFADGRENYEKGIQAARAAIVPPVALFFSLLGAIGHLSKLMYLLLKVGVDSMPKYKNRIHYLWVVPLMTLCAAWVFLISSENAVTSGSQYVAMQKSMQEQAGENSSRLVSTVIANVVHGITTGQAYSYPVNEFIRTRVLGGITFGYDKDTQGSSGDLDKLVAEMRQGHCEPSAAQLRKGAQDGIPEFQFALGRAYFHGVCYTMDAPQAVTWFEKAAQQGLADAEFAMGVVYTDGAGVKENKSTAVQWYRKAADQGNAAAQFNLGMMYLDGIGVSKDERAALEYISKAAAQGDAKAQNGLGVMYLEGRGVGKDAKAAADWFRKAAAQGDQQAKTNLAHISRQDSASR